MPPASLGGSTAPDDEVDPEDDDDSPAGAPSEPFDAEAPHAATKAITTAEPRRRRTRAP